MKKLLSLLLLTGTLFAQVNNVFTLNPSVSSAGMGNVGIAHADVKNVFHNPAFAGLNKRHQEVFDATAIHSLELLASSLHGMLTSSANRWFSLRFKEVTLNENDEAKEWLENCERVMQQVFQRSNFQQEVFDHQRRHLSQFPY